MVKPSLFEWLFELDPSDDIQDQSEFACLRKKTERNVVVKNKKRYAKNVDVKGISKRIRKAR